MTAIVLASKSSARGAVLRGAGVSFTAAGSGVDEDAVKNRLLGEAASPRDIAQVLADAKAETVSRTHGGLVIGADQTLDLDGALFDKVATLNEARERLLRLRGRRHQLHSALAVAVEGQVIWRDLVSASLTMRAFSDNFLEGYLARNGQAILSSVGCYMLEGEGVQLFEAIDGDYFTILGLPLMGLLEFLRGKGAVRA